MIGVGITTRNRPHVLRTALEHFEKFGYGDKLVIVDDNSDEPLDLGGNYTVLRSPHRLGIARAKNACLAHLQDCDYVFLFDDDAWPRTEGWADKWVEINEHNGVGHSMWNTDLEHKEENRVPKGPDIVSFESIGDDYYKMNVYNNCLGVMLYFNRACLNAIGGYDHSAQNVYGFEHAQVSMRASRAGFCQGYNYLSPAVARQLVYSFDISWCWKQEESPLEVPWKDEFQSSVTPEEAAAHPLNSVLMNRQDVHIPLDDPFNPLY